MSVGLAAPRLEPVVAPPLASLALGRSVGGVAAKERSFWSSLPGLLTGLAGVLTGVVALLGLALNQGWLGDGPEEDSDGGGQAEVVDISFDPTSIDLNQATERAGSIDVKNDGTEPVELTVGLQGRTPEAFSITENRCGGALPPGRSCRVTVSLDAGPGRHEALLVATVVGGREAAEAPLNGTAVLPNPLG